MSNTNINTGSTKALSAQKKASKKNKAIVKRRFSVIATHDMVAARCHGHPIRHRTATFNTVTSKSSEPAPTALSKRKSLRDNNFLDDSNAMITDVKNSLEHVINAASWCSWSYPYILLNPNLSRSRRSAYVSSGIEHLAYSIDDLKIQETPSADEGMERFSFQNEQGASTATIRQASKQGWGSPNKKMQPICYPAAHGCGHAVEF